MILHWHRKSFAVGERFVNTYLVAKRFEMMDNVTDDHIVWARSIIIISDADVNVRWV